MCQAFSFIFYSFYLFNAFIYAKYYIFIFVNFHF